MRSILARCLVYVVGVVVLSYMLTAELADVWLLGPVREAVAAASAITLSLLGLPSEASGEIVRLPRGSVQIVNGCTGVDVMVLLAAAVLIFPASWRAKGIGVGLAVATIGLCNYVRVITLCYLVALRPAYLDAGHAYLWPAIITLVCLGTLLLWIQKFAEPRP